MFFGLAAFAIPLGLALASTVVTTVGVQKAQPVYPMGGFLLAILVIPGALGANALWLALAFDEVASVEPSMKASVLSERISTGMNGFAISAVAGVIAGVIAVAGLIRAVIASREATRAEAGGSV